MFKKYSSKEDIISALQKRKNVKKNRKLTKSEATKIYGRCKNMLKKYNNSYKFNSNKFISDKNKY